jgi:hypothetical protein
MIGDRITNIDDRCLHRIRPDGHDDEVIRSPDIGGCHRVGA